MSKSSKHGMGITRRGVLKGGAAVAGFAAGSGVVTGFPTIWAQNIKDVTLNHTGQSYSTLIDIARQASQDLGFKVEMSVTDHPGMTNRIVNDPASIDIADCEIWQTKVFVPLGKYPILLTGLTDNTTAFLNLRGSSAAYYRLTVAAGKEALLTFATGQGLPNPRLRFIVVRTQ